MEQKRIEWDKKSKKYKTNYFGALKMLFGEIEKESKPTDSQNRKSSGQDLTISINPGMDNPK